MDVETLIKAALREAGYGPDAIGSALPRILPPSDEPRILATARALKSGASWRGSQVTLGPAGQETPVTLLRYIETVGLGNLGINLDPANLLMYGRGNPIDALEVFGKHVRCIHAKDGRVPTNGMHLGPEVKVGEGMVRYPEFIRRLLEIGFAGDLIIEREISGDQQKKDIAATVRYLETLLSAAVGPKE